MVYDGNLLNSMDKRTRHQVDSASTASVRAGDLERFLKVAVETDG